MTPVRLEPAALRSRVKHSTTEPLRSLQVVVRHNLFFDIQLDMSSLMSWVTQVYGKLLTMSEGYAQIHLLVLHELDGYFVS